MTPDAVIVLLLDMLLVPFRIPGLALMAAGADTLLYAGRLRGVAAGTGNIAAMGVMHVFKRQALAVMTERA